MRPLLLAPALLLFAVAARAQSDSPDSPATLPLSSILSTTMPQTGSPPATDRALLSLLDSNPTTNTPTVAWTAMRGAIMRSVADPAHPVAPSPMMYYAAAGAGDREMVVWLKNHGDRIDAIDPGMYCSALHMAVLDSKTTAARILLDAGASARTYDARSSLSAILDAVNLDDEATAKLLLEHGADPNVKTPGTGLTPIHSAAIEGSLRMAEILLAHGANPNQPDTNGVRPLHMAVLKKRLAMIRLLVEHGADPNLASDAGTTPLHVAERQKFANIVALLKSLGAKETPDPHPMPAPPQP